MVAVAVLAQLLFDGTSSLRDCGSRIEAQLTAAAAVPAELQWRHCSRRRGNWLVTLAPTIHQNGSHSVHHMAIGVGAGVAAAMTVGYPLVRWLLGTG